MKKNQKYPDFMLNADIVSLYKNKGESTDLKNDRGVFILSAFRSILDKMIYNDKYDYIEENMSDSNIDTRKKQNVRNHLWVLNGMLNSVKNGESKTVYEPIFKVVDNELRCRYLRNYVDDGHKISNEPLTKDKIIALDLLDELSKKEENIVNYDLKPKDMLFFNNHRILN